LGTCIIFNRRPIGLLKSSCYIQQNKIPTGPQISIPIIDAPSYAKATETARPIPRAAPVMTTKCNVAGCFSTINKTIDLRTDKLTNAGPFKMLVAGACRFSKRTWYSCRRIFSLTNFVPSERVLPLCRFAALNFTRAVGRIASIQNNETGKPTWVLSFRDC
jgi:hypothetical protein